MAAITSVSNETPSRLTLTNIDEERMVLAPLQEKAVTADSGFDFDELERKGIVRTRKDAPSSVGENIGVALIGGGFWLVILASGLSKTEPLFGLPAAQWPLVVWGAGLLIILVVVIALIIKGTNSLSLVARWTMNAVALTMILAIGLGLPAATIYFFGGGRELRGIAPGAAAVPPLALFGRLMQLAVMATASLLPVLLFFLFDRYQLSTLRRQLYVSLFRLDPSVKTIAEINAKYGSQIGETYGSDEQGRGRLAPGTRWPVLVCAFVMTLGWIVALAPVGDGFRPTDGAGVLASLVPQRSAVVFGFLGVYFFSLRLIALRYARGDLKPKAYTNIMVRLFVVLVLSWVLEAIFVGDSGVVLVLAFLFGITPDEFFTWLKETFRDKLPASALPQSSLPLNELEGIDLYDLARLESEGIVNIEGLAHHELIDLIIETRIPVPRLIDWVDQAILYLHVAGGANIEARATLREYGIRTATDLTLAWDKARGRGDAEMDGFKKLLGGAAPPFRLEVILDALRDDEWFATVSWWRRHEPHPDLNELAAPSSADALRSMAEKEVAAKRYRRALRLLSQSLTLQDTAAARRRMAGLFASSPVVEIRDSAQAKVHARRAYELAPDEYENAIELSEIYAELDETMLADDMFALASKALDAWPKERQREREAQKKRVAELRATLDARAAARQTHSLPSTM